MDINDILKRQNGMCASCGIIFNNNDNLEKHLLTIEPMINISEEENKIQENIVICNHCLPYFKKENGNTIKVNFHTLQYANFETLDEELLFQELKIQYENIIHNELLKERRNKIRDLLQYIKNFNITKQEFEEFINQMKSTMEDLNKKITEDLQKTEEELLNNYKQVKEIINEAIQFAENTNDFRTAREKIVSAQTKLNSTKVKKEHREELSNLIFEQFNKLNQRQQEEWERYEMECSENYLTLKPKVEEAVKFASTCENFNQGRETLIKVQNEFRGLKLKKEQRDELFKKIQNAFVDLNNRQAKEREEFLKASEENYKTIKKLVDEAVQFSKIAIIFKEAREKLIQAQNAIKEARLLKEKKDELFATIRKAFEELNERQNQEMSTFDQEAEDNYNKLSAKIQDMFEEIKNSFEFGIIRDKLIALQSEVRLFKLKRDHRTELFAKIREAFSLFDKRRNEHRDKIKQEKIEKLTGIKENLQNKIMRLKDSIQWDARSLKYQKDKLNALPADTPDEVKNEINEIINTIETRIKEKEANIEDITKRIADIENELGKL